MEAMKFLRFVQTALACGLLSVFAFAACSDDDTPAPTPTPTKNDAVMILDKDKRDMIYSMVDLEGDRGRIYEINYNVDYKLDEALKFEIDGTVRLQQFVALYLMDTIPQRKSVALSYDAGCSAFAAPDTKSGDFLMGRNFDFNHWDKDKNRVMIPLIAVHTAPKGGKKSVSFVDGQFVGYKSGFYTDGNSDLSMLMALPYLMLDGINEDGFAISVLKLDGKQTLQQKAGQKKVFTTVAMRLLLDRAGTVDEAIEILSQYNMCMDQDSTASYHFFMADAKGDYAIVEYTPKSPEAHPTQMEVLRGHDTLRCVTNFYVSPNMLYSPNGGLSYHGRDRYNNLRKGLLEHNYNVTPTQGMDLLKVVAQGPDGDQGSTGFTQWSEMYNLSKKRVTMHILREWEKPFVFQVK